MKEKATVTAYDGSILATWKTAKPSKRFSAELLKSAMPQIYEQFVVESTRQPPIPNQVKGLKMKEKFDAELTRLKIHYWAS
jgi:hypothetical protein